MSGSSRWVARSDFSSASLQGCSLHAGERLWQEKNCYSDIWISVLHAAGLEAHACLAYTLATDFDGDQWTFFKPSHDDLFELYGVEVQELTVWKPLIEHAREHLAAGRLISTESDAWWLPDTAGTDYRTKHTKTTIVLNEVDLDRRRLGYFHNTGYHFLEGEDFDRTFHLPGPPPADFMPLFAELVKLDRVVRRSEDELRAMARALLPRHLRRRPATNPFTRFQARWREELPSLQAAGLDHYHAWAFANTRQAGAAFELAAQHLGWLNAEADPALEQARQHFEAMAATMKAMILKGARLVMSKRAADEAALFGDCAARWESAMGLLTRSAT